MESLFEARLEGESQLRLWLDTCADVGVSAPREHLQILANDFYHGARALAKTPRFVAAALLAIVVGVSTTTTVFSLISAVLLRSLPYGNGDRLVYLWTPSPSTANRELERQPSYADMIAWGKLSRSFQDITAMQRYVAVMNDQKPERVGAVRVLGNFFRTLEVQPRLGRAINADDEQPGKQWVVVLSDRIWQSRFGGNPSVVGTTVHLDRRLYRVVGVMPKEFSYPHGNDFPGQYQFASIPRTDLWVPAAFTRRQQADIDFDGLDAVIGRIRPGVSVSRAQSEINALEKRLNPLHADGDRDLQAVLISFVETSLGPARPLLRLLTGAVCMVLLMVCANFASLLTARAGDRVHEIGVRAALGAQRSRLVRLLLTESLMLSFGGGLLAIPLSYAGVKELARLNPGDIPRFEETSLDMHVLVFGLSISFATGLISGAFPAVTASLVNVVDLLRQGGRGVAGGASLRARNTLIISEIAIAVVLLADSGLLIRSYLVVQREDKGFAESTLTMSMLLDDPAKNADSLRRELMDRIRALPGVKVAGSIDDLPLSTFEDKAYVNVEGSPTHLKELASVRETGGEYFRAMQIPLIAGRYLMDQDIQPRSDVLPQSVVVSKSFVDRYLPGKDALRHRLRINGGGWGSGWSTIVGVVGDVRHSSLEEKPRPIIYYQNGFADSVALQSVGSPDTVVSSILKAVTEFDSGFSITDVQTMSQYVDHAAARRRFQTVALASFAGVAVLLALVGLYSLLSHTVTQRTAEIGVRATLGASRLAIIQMVALYGLKLASAGVAIGIGLALVSSHVTASFLYGVNAVDSITFGAVPVVILVVVIIACIAPAWKAARIAPAEALRHR